MYSKPHINRIQVDRHIYLSYTKIRLMGSEIKGFGMIVPEILSEICEDSTYARFTVSEMTNGLKNKPWNKHGVSLPWRFRKTA